jgi:hypothetical protein
MPAFDSAGDPAHCGVDEQCAESGGGRYLTLQDIDMVGQVIAFEPGVGQHHDGILHMIILKNRPGYSLLNRLTSQDFYNLLVCPNHVVVLVFALRP